MCWSHMSVMLPSCVVVMLTYRGRYQMAISQTTCCCMKMLHDDVIKWKHFPRYWPFVRRIHRSPVNSPHKGQRRGTLMFSLICVWINDWVNNGEAGDLRRYRIHYDVTVMWYFDPKLSHWGRDETADYGMFRTCIMKSFIYMYLMFMYLQPIKFEPHINNAIYLCTRVMLALYIVFTVVFSYYGCMSCISEHWWKKVDQSLNILTYLGQWTLYITQLNKHLAPDSRKCSKRIAP